MTKILKLFFDDMR